MLQSSAAHSPENSRPMMTTAIQAGTSAGLNCTSVRTRGDQQLVSQRIEQHAHGW